jgi:hypothetical protein
MAADEESPHTSNADDKLRALLVLLSHFCILVVDSEQIKTTVWNNIDSLLDVVDVCPSLDLKG